MKVLAIGCHPDDLEIACGGTLRKYVEQGAEVHMCHVANGNQGHVVIEPDPLREIRTLEAERAGAILGAKQVINLDVNDVEVNSRDWKVMDAMADPQRRRLYAGPQGNQCHCHQRQLLLRSEPSSQTV